MSIERMRAPKLDNENWSIFKLKLIADIALSEPDKLDIRH